MKKLYTLLFSACLISLSAQSIIGSGTHTDSKSTQDANQPQENEIKILSSEIQTRPISLLQGIYTLGFETRIAPSTSFLLDFGGGTSLFDNSELVTGMIGIRYYIGPNGDRISGSFLSFRHRSRLYTVPPLEFQTVEGTDYGANTNFMFGSKFLLGPTEKLSATIELGLGRQTWLGSTVLLPTWAITLGFRF